MEKSTIQFNIITANNEYTAVIKDLTHDEWALLKHLAYKLENAIANTEIEDNIAISFNTLR